MAKRCPLCRDGGAEAGRELQNTSSTYNENLKNLQVNKMTNEEAKDKIKKTTAAILRIERKAQDENRGLTREESALVAELNGAVEAYKMELPERSLTLQGFGGNRSNGPFGTLGQQLMAIREAGTPSGQVDPRLHEIRAAASGLNETTPSEGAFLLQQDFNASLLQDTFNAAVLAPLCRKAPIGANSNSMKLPGVDETSRATGSRAGGVTGYWGPEAGQLTSSKPKFRQIELTLKKAHVFVYATDELLADAVALEAYIRQAAPAELAFMVDDSIIRGTGTGQPLGILNAGCLVSVAKETGQKAATIVAENIIKMEARMIGTGASAYWLANKNIKSQLYTMSLAVGTGGVPVYMPAGGLSGQPYPTLFGRPVLYIEQAATLGDLGDIIYGDFTNGYILAEKGGVESAMSIHVRFEFDESVFRFILRVDGQPVRASALTPYKGGASNTESCFVALAARE